MDISSRVIGEAMKDLRAVICKFERLRCKSSAIVAKSYRDVDYMYEGAASGGQLALANPDPTMSSASQHPHCSTAIRHHISLSRKRKFAGLRVPDSHSGV
jgi:hypothetical protein